MKKTKLMLIVSGITISSMLFTGCVSSGLVADDSYNRTKIGAGLGALAGGIIAYQSSKGEKGSKKRTNAALGALGGAVLGGGAGYALDIQANKVANALGTGVNNDPLAEIDPNKELIVSKHENYVKIMFRDPKMFASGSSHLNSYTQKNIVKVGQLLKQYPKTLIVVSGHTDNTGKASTNQRLSNERAQSVSDTLNNTGIKNEQFLEGCSFKSPIVGNSTSTDRALNRRIEVYLYNEKNKIATTCN